MFDEISEPPKKGRSGLAKATAVFASIFGISLGLCGMNFMVLTQAENKMGEVLIVTAYIEVIGMLVGLAGLFFIGVTFAVQELKRSLRRDK